MLKIIIYCAVCFVVLLVFIVISGVKNKKRKMSNVACVLNELLPGLNCKQCGRNDCQAFAVDLSKGKTMPDQCPFLEGKNYIKCRQVLKRERKIRVERVAIVKCKGGCDANSKYDYIGDSTCSSLCLLHKGNKFCQSACLGCGDCVKSCIYGAISISKKGCAIVDPEKCVGCGECIAACPKKIIELIPSKKFVEVICKNNSNDSAVIRNCSVACTHCEACVVACPSNAIEMVDGLPRIDDTKCTKCGKCVAACPEHVISRL